MNNIKSWKRFLVQESIDPERVVYAVIHNGHLLGIFGDKKSADELLFKIAVEENPRVAHNFMSAHAAIEHEKLLSELDQDETEGLIALAGAHIVRSNSGFRYNYDNVIKEVSGIEDLSRLLKGDFSSWPGGESEAEKRIKSLVIRKNLF